VNVTAIVPGMDEGELGYCREGGDRGRDAIVEGIRY